MPEAVTARPARKAVASPLGTVAKAKNKPQLTAVYDQNGRLIGIVDPKNITPAVNSAPAAKPADAATKPAAGATQRTATNEDAMAKVAQLRKTAFRGDTPAERNQAFDALCAAATAAITAAQRRGGTGQV